MRYVVLVTLPPANEKLHTCTLQDSMSAHVVTLPILLNLLSMNKNAYSFVFYSIDNIIETAKMKL